MRTNYLMSVALLLALSVVSGCAKPKSFSTAQEAVEFIAGALDANDSSILTDACVGGREGNPPFRTRPDSIFAALKQLHDKTPIQELLAGGKFPDGVETCVLGGHGPPLNHINIEFARREDLWYLANIWVCR